MNATQSLPLKIKPNLLFTIYACIPAAALIAILDNLILHGSMQRLASVDPNNYALFTLLFTLPHILSSFFSFFDKEYITTYQKKLLTGARYAVFAAILLPLISIQLAFVVFAIFTMYHVFRQQSGIAKSLMRGTGKYHAYWEFGGIALSLALYLDLYTSYRASPVAIICWVLGFIIYTAVGIMAARAATTTLGKRYFWMTHCIPLASAIFLLSGYPILSIAVPRIIHDLTAYTFYITHDYNRYADTGGNYLYRAFAKIRLPVTILNPAVSITLALLFQQFSMRGAYMTLTVLFLFHYYIESFIWKRESLHRHYIAYAS